MGEVVSRYETPPTFGRLCAEVLGLSTLLVVVYVALFTLLPRLIEYGADDDVVCCSCMDQAQLRDVPRPQMERWLRHCAKKTEV
jgi:hypothetical protein